MIQHFKLKPLYNAKLPGWQLTFYNARTYYEVIYNADGTLTCVTPKEKVLDEQLVAEIQALMAFHVYD